MKFHYDAQKAEDTIQFISALTHTKGRWAGSRFQVLDWQDVLLRQIFGWVDDNGYRQFRTVYVEAPKKNGKSELASAVALKLLVADDEQGAEVYSGAVDREQASLVFNVAAKMVKNNKILRKRLKIIDSQKRIVDHKTNSVYHVLSSDVGSKHGLNVHGLILDELHAIKEREFVDVLTEGSGDARTQPLTFIITTAGIADQRYVCWEYHNYACNVRDGVVRDDRFFPFILGLEQTEDWEDEENWKKVNPSLGRIFEIDKIREDYEKARVLPSRQNNFRRLRLNQWVQQATRWLDMRVWDACNSPANMDKGRRCYLGIDLSSSKDLSAVAMVMESREPGDPYDVYVQYFLPQDNMEKRVKEDRVPYDIWARQKYIILTPGNVIDYDFIMKWIEDMTQIYEIVEIAYDRWGAVQMSVKLAEKGFTVVPIGQGFASMSPPTKEFETILLQRRFRHGGHPVLRWNANNMVVRTDPAGNIKPDKEKSSERIDGIVAMIMAFDRAMRNERAASVYETRGLISAGQG